MKIYTVFLAFVAHCATIPPLETTIGPLDYCGGDTSIFSVENVVITPFPPKIGQNLTISAAGTLLKPIAQNTSLVISGKWGYVPVFKQTHDFCEASAAFGKPCPVAEGPFSFEYSQQLPSNVPEVTIYITVNMLDAEKKLITCLTGGVPLIL